MELLFIDKLHDTEKRENKGNRFKYISLCHIIEQAWLTKIVKVLSKHIIIGNWSPTVFSVNLLEQRKTKTKNKTVLVLIWLWKCMRPYELLVLGWIWITWGNCSEAWFHLLWKIFSLIPRMMRRWPHSEWQRGNLSFGLWWWWQQQQYESKSCQYQGPTLHRSWGS